MENYVGLTWLGVLVLLFLVPLLIKSKLSFEAPMLGALVTGVVLISIGLLKPDNIAVGDLRLKIERVEEKIRPYALVAIDGSEVEVVHTTFATEKFKIIEISHREQFIKFFISGSPSFVSITPDGYNKFTIHPIEESKVSGGVEYKASWIKHEDSEPYELEKLIIEAVI